MDKFNAEQKTLVKGNTLVSRGEKNLTHKNQRTQIQLGVKHKLENLLEADLELIEVQSVDYLGECEIVYSMDT